MKYENYENYNKGLNSLYFSKLILCDNVWASVVAGYYLDCIFCLKIKKFISNIWLSLFYIHSLTWWVPNTEKIHQLGMASIGWEVTMTLEVSETVNPISWWGLMAGGNKAKTISAELLELILKIKL